MSDLKALVTENFQEWIDGLQRKQELSKVAKWELKKNEEYKKLLKEKKVLLVKIKAIEENIPANIEIKKINENVSMIKESLVEELEVKKPIITKLFGFYKTKFETNNDILDEINNTWMGIFQE